MTDIMREWNEALTAPKCEHGHLSPVCDLCKKDAEIARLTAERDAAFTMSRCECATDEACANLAKLHAEVAGLREDAERYRWLRDKFSRIACNVNLAWDAAQAETIKIESLWVMEHFRATDPESTDTAIDAARKGTT